MNLNKDVFLMTFIFCINCQKSIEVERSQTVCVCVLVIEDDFQLSSFAGPDPANYLNCDG